jgi:hypothetical protein
MCGWDRKLGALGLTDDGCFEPVHANELSLRLDHIGGRGRLRVERLPLPLPFAIGMRDALRAALARVEAEIAAATGGEDV